MRFRIIFYRIGTARKIVVRTDRGVCDMEQNELKILRIRSLAQILCIVLGVYLIQMLCATLWAAIAVLFNVADPSAKLMEMSVVSAFLVILWCCLFYYQSGWGIFGYRRVCSVKAVISILGLGMGGCIVLALLLSFLQTLFPAAFAGYTKVMDQFGRGEQVITLLYTIGMGPIMEELIFRGAVLDRLRLAAYPFWLANLIQAALFGIYHMNLIQGIYGFLWGMLLGALYQASGSILASILAHMTFNTTNYLLMWLFPQGKPVSIPLYLGIFLFGVIFFAVGLCYTRKMLVSKRAG